MSEKVSATLPNAIIPEQEVDAQFAGSSAQQAVPVHDSCSLVTGTLERNAGTQERQSTDFVGREYDEDEESHASTLNSLKTSLNELNLMKIIEMIPDHPRSFKPQGYMPSRTPSPEYLDLTAYHPMAYPTIMATPIWPVLLPTVAPYYPQWSAAPAMSHLQSEALKQTKAISKARRATKNLEIKSVMEKLAGTKAAAPSGQLQGCRVVIMGLEPHITSAQVLDCFRVCGQIEFVSKISDAQLQVVSHIAISFGDSASAQNAVHLAAMAEFPSLGGRVFAEISEGPFTVSGRTLELDFGLKIPFDRKAREGMRVTFGNPIKLSREGNLVRMLFSSHEDAQVAFIKAGKINISAIIL